MSGNSESLVTSVVAALGIHEAVISSSGSDLSLSASLSPLTREEPVVSLTARMHYAALITAKREQSLALEHIIETEEQYAGFDALLKLCEARLWLNAKTQPKARGATEALKLVQHVQENCIMRKHRFLREKIRQLLIHIRNVVMLLCRASCEDLYDRGQFLNHLQKAFNREPDIVEKAQILLAYSLNRDNRRYGFMSNNALCVMRTQRRRPARVKRRKHLEEFMTRKSNDDDAEPSDDFSETNNVASRESSWKACSWHCFGPQLLSHMNTDSLKVKCKLLGAVQIVYPHEVVDTTRSAGSAADTFSLWHVQIM